MHEFEFDPAARNEARCPPGTGMVIGICCGLMFWIGLVIGMLVGAAWF